MPDLPPEPVAIVSPGDVEVADYRLPSGNFETRIVPLGVDCSQASEREIVVCRQTGRSPLISDLPLPEPPPLPTSMDNLSEALRFKIGPVTIGSFPTGNGTYAFGLALKF